ncbi:tetratricopeptide repeat protein [Nodosilinea sp. FACHB-141]|uniref:tetratricopeptide repeat protein n=1 Tax=Nodosilinea sp. FACHB-141 TaxID=2692833 RepID=UPI0016822C16|nr:tetratricopeptide repeat protein [Nodosilinea sp. FACHB-141]
MLKVLNARDVLYVGIEQSPPPKPHLLSEIHALDRQLKDQAAVMAEQLNFSTYRQSFSKSPEQWWWFLDETLKVPSSNPDDWVFKGLTTLTWAIIVGLLINISGRFLLGGAGVAGLSAIALSNLLTLLQARSDLTDAGGEGVQFFFDRFKVSNPWRLRAKFGTTALLAGVLFAFWLALPSISRQYNQRGQTAQEAGKLGSAEQNYNRAIALNPDNVDAHYNLGTLYEDIQNLEQAETQYLIAIRGDLPEAYNNLARLYLEKPEPNLNKSLALLNQGLTLADEQQSFPETKYSLYKNLGWALFRQEQYASAQSALETAIVLSAEREAQPHINNPGSAHCLLAQTLEAQAQGETDTLPVWQRCCQLGDRGNPEENAWLMLARERFESATLDYNDLCRPTATPL